MTRIRPSTIKIGTIITAIELYGIDCDEKHLGLAENLRRPKSHGPMTPEIVIGQTVINSED